MATSSIFDKIEITEPEQAKAFMEALESSIADPMPRSDAPLKTVLTDPDKIRELWNKRKGDK